MSNSLSFKGMGSVFAFTFKQNAGTKVYKAVTAVVGLIIIAAIVAINVYTASDHSTEVKKILVCDSTGLEGASKDIIKEFMSQANENYENTDVELIDKGKDKIIEAVTDDTKAVGVLIEKEEEKFVFTALWNDIGNIGEDDANEVAGYISNYYSQVKIANANLTPEQLAVVMTPVMVSESKIGDDTSMTKQIINMVAPLLFSFVMYFMLLIYGQTISKLVIAEKTSKLMEYILTSTRSNSLMAGKILAMSCAAILQVFVWVVCVGVGLVAGDYAGKAVNPDYQNVIVNLIKTIKNEAHGALTIWAMVLAFLVFVIGFVFFAVLAGLVASFVQKAETLSQAMMVFQYTVIIGFFIAYFGIALEKKSLITLSYYLPICSPFSLPANIIIGSATPIKIAVSTGILLVSCVVLVIATARVYKGMVLYNGAKITPKVIGKAFLGKI